MKTEKEFREGNQDLLDRIKSLEIKGMYKSNIKTSLEDGKFLGIMDKGKSTFYLKDNNTQVLFGWEKVFRTCRQFRRYIIIHDGTAYVSGLCAIDVLDSLESIRNKKPESLRDITNSELDKVISQIRKEMSNMKSDIERTISSLKDRKKEGEEILHLIKKEILELNVKFYKCQYPQKKDPKIEGGILRQYRNLRDECQEIIEYSKHRIEEYQLEYKNLKDHHIK